jgi:hypothetical protein
MQGLLNSGELSLKRLFPNTPSLIQPVPGAKAMERCGSQMRQHRPYLSSRQATARPLRSLRRLLPAPQAVKGRIPYTIRSLQSCRGLTRAPCGIYCIVTDASTDLLDR